MGSCVRLPTVSMERSVTLKDVAREAGVHMSTASRALNPDTIELVNAKTAERILLVADRLGYRAHSFARGLRTNRTFTVGMIIPDLTNPVFPPIYAGAAETLARFGYSLLIVEARDTPDEDWLTETLRDRRVDGLILATTHLGSSTPPSLIGSDLAVVLVNRHNEDWIFPSIVGDDHAGVGLVVKHLVSKGHTAIAHVAGPGALSTGLARRQAFVAWVMSSGLEASPELIVEADSFQIDAGRLACDRLIESGVEFSALVAANDLIALGCLDSLGHHGIRVPADVSLTGYNDMMFVDRIGPPLTTIAVPYRDMGARAARVILDLMRADPVDLGGSARHSTRLAPTLVVRESTGPPSGRR